MRDMNIAKLTSVDVPLFNAIVQDLFPNTELPVIDYGKVFAFVPVYVVGVGSEDNLQESVPPSSRRVLGVRLG